MKIAVTATGPSVDAQIEARFGRAQYFLIIDTDTMDCETIQNPNVSAGGGAGIQSAQIMANKGVKTILTGNCGPNAFQVFSASGIQVVTGVSGAVRQAVENFKSRKFTSASQPNVESHFGIGRGMGQGIGSGGGMGTGRGMGQGMGSGRGMGAGRGMGMGQAGVQKEFQPEATGEDEMSNLKEQARMLQEQLKEIQKHIDDVEKEKVKK